LLYHCHKELVAFKNKEAVMSHKALGQSVVLALFVLALLGTPSTALAGGVCGGTWVADPGDTVEKLAAMCGTTTAAIYAANPGISGALTVGQVLTIPGSNYGAPSAPPADTNSPTIINYNTYNYYNYYSAPPAGGYSGKYTVQYGDTFAKIAARFGVSIQALWTANPQVKDINLVYVGQVLNVPSSSGPGSPPVSTKTPTALTYSGDIPKNAPRETITLINNANAEVYISLRTSRADGTNAIHEYPVSGTTYATIPVGWIDYVAWVGGVKYTGGFKLSEGANITITFNKSKVVVN
jgi:LysM repeat protein